MVFVKRTDEEKAAIAAKLAEEAAAKFANISPSADSVDGADESIPYGGLHKEVAGVDILACKDDWKAILYNNKDITMARTIGYVTEKKYVVQALLYPEKFDLRSDPDHVVMGDTFVVLCKQADYEDRMNQEVANWHSRNMGQKNPNITESLVKK
jgi:hypothetical protein